MVGRPEDPQIREKALAATLDIYERVGWAAFTFDAVAREAGIGKAAIYRRWDKKEELIVDALTDLAMRLEPSTMDLGSLRADLIAMGELTVDRLYGVHGVVLMRAQVEALMYAELAETMDRLRRMRTDVGRVVVIRAIDRGELPAGASPALILDVLIGTLERRVLVTPVGVRGRLRTDRSQLVATVVDLILDGLGPGPTVETAGSEAGA